MKRILALDFDGVLNSIRWFNRRGRGRAEEFAPENIRWLNELVEAAQPKIVISSAWRLDRSVARLRELLANSGFAYPQRVIGKTREGSHRGEEIEDFCWRTFFHPRDLVILDDDADMGRLMPRLVRTNFRYGLRRRHMREALRLWA